VVLFSSCDIINPPETIPARIQLNPVEFQIEPGQGTARQKITEVWVFANSSVLGAFTPPVEIHHLTDMPTSDFSFRGGIRNNGILEDAIIYPMFTTYDVELPTEPGALSVVTPIIRYKPEAVFSLIADFETQNDFVDNRDSIPESVVTRSPVDPYEGNFSGEIIMNATANFIEVGHAIAMTDLPTNGTPVYLEFHYKSEVEMSIGILGITLNGQSFSNFFYLLRPSESWNKIYIELTDLIEESDFPSYKILFRSLYPEGSTEPSYKIQIDNIKVVHL
jgi:hypothetical protein